jgi:site-specific recombinase XerD
MTWAETLAKYRVNLTLKGFTPATLKTYTQGLTTFGEFLDAEGLEPLRVQPRHADEYAARLYERYGNRPSVNVKIRALKSLYGWLHRQGKVFVDPTRQLKEPRIQRIPRDVLSEREVLKVLEQPDVTDPFGLRDRAMMEVLYGSGFRIGALLSMTINDLDLEGMTASVGRDKGGKPKVRPLTQPACEFLKAYVTRVRPLLSSITPAKTLRLWLNEKGGAMRELTLQRIVGGYGLSAGLTKRVTPHSFRHAFATALVRRGVDIRYVQELLGHVMPSTTQVYTHVAGVDVKKAVKFHPRYDHAEDLEPNLNGGFYHG